MSTPLVSVVVPVHGRVPYLDAALGSVAAQTYELHETIVVLDGPYSELPALDPCEVRVLEQPHAGVAAARNAGIRTARGELIALLDQDDEWLPHKLERQVALLEERPRLDFVLCNFEVLLDPETPPPHWLDPTWMAGPVRGLHPSTWLVRSETFADVGGFDDRYEMACDSDWLARASIGAWRSEIIEEPLVRWRLHRSNASHDQLMMRREVFTMVRHHAARKQRARELRVGAVIAARNYERYVGPAIDSLLTQTQRPCAIVVVDDGSSDATADVAGCRPVKVVRIEHAGIGAARSRGVAELPDVDAVVMLDADDMLTPDSIERRAQVLSERPEIDIVFGHGQRFERVVDGEALPIGPPQPAHTTGAMMVRRSALERVGPFTRELRVAEGLDWLLRARELGLREATVPELVYWRRVHGKNNSLRNRDALDELPRALKASLDRRRASSRGAG